MDVQTIGSGWGPISSNRAAAAPPVAYVLIPEELVPSGLCDGLKLCVLEGQLRKELQWEGGSELLGEMERVRGGCYARRC